MKLYVPYTEVGEATQAFLCGYSPIPVVLSSVAAGPHAYLDYFQRRWDEGEGFITMEHDIVPWPGAIESLLDCPHEWCFFGYQPDVDCLANSCAPLGLQKITAALIEALPGTWNDMRTNGVYGGPGIWRYCDFHLFRVGVAVGFIPHQHYPAVFNANLKILSPLRQQHIKAAGKGWTHE